MGVVVAIGSYQTSPLVNMTFDVERTPFFFRPGCARVGQFEWGSNFFFSTLIGGYWDQISSACPSVLTTSQGPREVKEANIDWRDSRPLCCTLTIGDCKL